jgi:hypothetical protein
MKKTAEQIANQVIHKIAFNPVTTSGHFEGDAKEWEEYIRNRSKVVAPLLGLLGGGAGAAIGSTIPDLFLKKPMSTRMRLISALLGGGAGALQFGGLTSHLTNKELANTSSSDWQKGLEAYNKRQE